MKARFHDAEPDAPPIIIIVVESSEEEAQTVIDDYEATHCEDG